jgi:uncharacterized protein (TIGR03000 family)
MPHPQRSLTWAATLATAALLLATRPAAAQTGYYYDTFRYGYNPGYYARRYTPSLYGYGGNAKTAPSPSAAGTWRFYSAPSAVPPKGGARALIVSSARGAEPAESTDTTAQIELRVPAGAEVWLDGARTRQTGEVRLYVSPPLTAGKEYSYQVRVTWKDGDKEKSEDRELTIRAGARLSASFPAAVGE